MSELAGKFDDLLRFQGHTMIHSYQDYIAQKAKSHAKEFDLWRERVKAVPREQKWLA
jgi:hypothetical protein